MLRNISYSLATKTKVLNYYVMSVSSNWMTLKNFVWQWNSVLMPIRINLESLCWRLSVSQTIRPGYLYLLRQFYHTKRAADWNSDQTRLIPCLARNRLISVSLNQIRNRNDEFCKRINKTKWTQKKIDTFFYVGFSTAYN